MTNNLSHLNFDDGIELAEDTLADDLGMRDVDGVLDLDFESDLAETCFDDLGDSDCPEAR